ncbi:PREDICTED: synaptonemal complex protein 2-like [Corvus brachyrhynchos]|uniref:synaptonemal complex protein 2-like n=1 Tax=Corvus brachyrhynchos TaxID=85066 RepID=UPI0008163FE1|nr:PREDICTED: synaptonemal complex protein 2-like [Corvus brachyrhynchos]
MAQLESLLIDAFKGKGFQKIHELLQEGEVEPPQRYNDSLLNQLDKALRKELDKNEFQNVSLMLKCIQLYLKSDLQEKKSLFIEQGLLAKMRKKELVNLFLPELGRLVTEANLCYALHLEVALSEALCRLMIKKWRDDLVHHWFEDNYLAEAFKEIKDREFETDCRKFLNLLNERLGDKRRKLGLILQLRGFLGSSSTALLPQVKKPSDEKLEEFWIDFNAGSQSVTFYVDCDEAALWDSVRLSKENVNSYSVKEEDGQKIVKIFMKIPSALNKTEVTKIKLVFSAEFEISNVLRKVLGDEKLMIVDSEEEIVLSGKPAIQNEAEIPVSSNAQRRTDPSNSENVETPKDNLTSQHRQQKMVNSGVAVVTVSQQTDLEDANQEKKSKTPSPRMKAKPSEKLLEEEPMDESIPKILQLSPFPKDVSSKKRNTRTSLARKKAEGRKEPYDFENSDSSSHEKVAAAKGKILAQKISSQNRRTYETRSKNKESSTLERRQSSYRKHLFSESNNENASTGQSEKSWILDSQIQLVPKSVDYTRKRPRVRSKLKVLPVSSASSGSDYESKKKFHGTPGKLSREEESIKRKDSDILSSTVIKKPKFSSLEKNHLPSETNHTPKKISDSVEEEAEIQKGQEMDDSLDGVLFSKMLHEDLSDSGVISAFESFIGQLKKLFWVM